MNEIQVLKYINKMKKLVKVPESKTFSDFLWNVYTTETENYQEVTGLHRRFDMELIKKDHEEFPLALLKYNTKHMFKNEWDDFTIQSRGLVIDWVNEELVLYPFDKFFEMGERIADSTKSVLKRLKNASIIELTDKRDGCLIIARKYRDDILVTSSGSFDSNESRKAYSMIKKDKYLSCLLDVHPSKTFIFELVEQDDNKKYVSYKETKLTVIGVRDMLTHRLHTNVEMRGFIREEYVVDLYNLDPTEVIESLDDPAVSNIEGYVLRIDNYFVKLKFKNYKLAHRISNLPSRNINVIITALEENRMDGIISLVPGHYRENFGLQLKAFKVYHAMKVDYIKSIIDEHKGLSVKMFALKMADNEPGLKKLLIYSFMNGIKDVPLSKKEVQYLKRYVKYYRFATHLDFCEMDDRDEKELLKMIKSGEVKYAETWTHEGVTTYLLSLLQFIKEEPLKLIK